MIEIIVNGNITIENLFDSYDIKSFFTSKEKITPKNNEIRKYCKFLKKYYGCNKEINYLDDFFVMEIDKEVYEKVNYSSVIEEDESFLFEFPDDYPEEELFYFKLKYI